MKKKILKICLVGKTNAGKSTLINNIVNENISIINKKINTTEDLISGILNIKNIQLIFFDTPGFNLTNQKKIKSIKIKKNIWDGLNNSDLILFIIDSKKYNFGESEKIIHKLNELKKPISIVFNKNDLLNKKLILPFISELNKMNICEEFFSISAKKNLGVNTIINFLLNKSYHSKWLFKSDEISNMDDIFITNECTRNSILTLLHKEIPYNVVVNNTYFKLLKNGHIKIKQEIIISNKRYKKIILGKSGSKIKEIRIRSQQQISKILKSKTHLYLNLTYKNVE